MFLSWQQGNFYRDMSRGVKNMGMYTQLVLHINLKEDTPEDVINILKYMMGEIETEHTDSHDLFDCEKWDWFLRSDSYYFSGFTKSEMRFDDISNCWKVNIHCNVKNYNHEIQKFWNWIKPHVDTDDLCGYYRYEENWEPTLLYGSERFY